MRELPAGIELRLAGREDAGLVKGVVDDGIEGYREWAPASWSPPQPTPEQLERIRGNFGSDRTWILMALAGDDAAGVVSLAEHTAAHPGPAPEGVIYLWQMFVQPEWQGTGLAAALMERALEEGARRGFDRMTLWTPEGAARARAFYERWGFTLSGNTDPDSKFGLPLVEYERNLTEANISVAER